MNAFAKNTIRTEIQGISAYPISDATGLVKLDVMENPYGLPEWLADEVANAVKRVSMNRYPIPSAPELKAMMREKLEIPASLELQLGVGSDECITYITQAIAKPGAKVLAPTPAFPMFKINAQWNYLDFIGVPLRADFSLDMPAMLAAIAEHRPALIWLAYPNNPTGNAYAETDIEAIIKAAPGLVVIDEAYQPFAKRTFLPRIAEFENLVVMRTLSKIGMAGLRLGYLMGAPAWLNEFNKVRSPFNVNVVTQAIVTTLLKHKHVLDEQCETINAERDRMFVQLQAMRGITAFPSAANFILARVKSAPDIFDGLKARGVLVKSFHGSHPLMENCLRLTIGTPSENAQLVSGLKALCSE
jgi:histidinol-phosphate aminotransferase